MFVSRPLSFAFCKHMIITKSDIVGSQIKHVHTVSGEHDGYPTCEVYFTTDNGLTFNMPWPGSVWETVKVPQKAVELTGWEDTDHIIFRIKKMIQKLFGTYPFEIDSPIENIKRKRIASILCPKMDEELGFYEPDSSIICFEDDSQAYCHTCAPSGIPIGLFYEKKLQNKEDLIDFFTVSTDINDF